MATHVLAGSKISNPELGLEYWQHRMGTSFDDLDCKRNYVYTSIDEAFAAAMKSSLKIAPQMKDWFLPVYMGQVNSKKVGIIGMIRHKDNHFEFSYLECGNRDRQVSIGQCAFWEEKAIKQVNDNTERDSNYPYYHNITQVEYKKGNNNDFDDLFFKAVLTFVNAFSRHEKRSLSLQA